MKILGLHFDRPFIRWASLDVKGKKIELQALKTMHASSEDDVKRLYNVEPKSIVASGINTLVRHLDFKIPSIKKIEQGLPFQIESLVSIPVDEVVYSTQITPVKGGADATIFLASRESLVSHLEQWKRFSIDPDLISSIPRALLNFAQFRCPNLQDGFVIYLGSSEATCIWFGKGVVQKAFVIDEGIEALLASLWEDRKKVLFQNEVKSVAKQIDLLQLKTHLNPQLSDRLEAFASKLSGVLYSFQQTAGALPVLFTGLTDAFGNLCPYLLKDTPEMAQYQPPLPINLAELKGAISIGLAIEASVKSQRKVQFLSGDFVPAKQWKRAGRFGIFFLSLSVVASVALAVMGISQIDQRKNSLAASLSALVGQVDKPLEATLFNEGIETGVALALRAIQKYDKEASFLLQSPTVSEVLAWVSGNSLFTDLAKAGDPVDVVDLKYKLVSFPRIGHVRDPYQAKVELQFRLKHSMSARKLHEEILRGDEFIDSSQEITWEAVNDRYHVSFYLKNRAPYVR